MCDSPKPKLPVQNNAVPGVPVPNRKKWDTIGVILLIIGAILFIVSVAFR